MIPTIHTNAQARLFRATHEKAYFMIVGSVATLHPIAIFIATSYLGLAIAAFAGLRGEVSPATAFTAILGISTILFIAWAGLMFAAADRAKKVLSAIQPPDMAEIEVAGIFKVQPKAVKK